VYFNDGHIVVCSGACCVGDLKINVKLEHKCRQLVPLRYGLSLCYFRFSGVKLFLTHISDWWMHILAIDHKLYNYVKKTTISIVLQKINGFRHDS
jgi:hypothetical protein